MQVSEEDIEEMFAYADKDSDGKISYTEFQTMINPPKPPPEHQVVKATTIAKKVSIKTPGQSDNSINTEEPLNSKHQEVEGAEIDKDLKTEHRVVKAANAAKKVTIQSPGQSDISKQEDSKHKTEEQIKRKLQELESAELDKDL